MDRYDRDMRGYGPRPPNAAWPNGAKVAVQFVLNYEEGGENNILHGDEASEAFLSDVIGAVPWPNQRHWNIESMYEYGARAGFWRLHRLFTAMKIPLTVYGVATALARSPDQVAAMREARWEIASHGYKWIDYKDFYEAEEKEHLEKAIALHREVVGARPRGLYVGRCSENTVQIATELGGFAYLSDSYADDLPYWVHISGKDQLIIPYTLEANDMRFTTASGFGDGEQFERYLKDTFDVLYAEGAAGAPKMMNIGLHCRLAGRPGRLMALKRFIDHAMAKEGVWFARRIDIARHWTMAHPPKKMSARPSQMDLTTFTNRFGSIFEHSQWVAERAHKLELGPAHDTPEGIHNAMARVFRRASEDERLGVLRAHPDLGDAITKADRLTDHSNAEQQGAGLTALTDEERRELTDLNERYVAKNGFPFIIAVKDHDKAGIIRKFHERMNNSKGEEMAEACYQVERIALHRLYGMDWT
ncbi:allantoinase PuuE [Vannielia litorea]|uniref:allantoinase PuuE n=1 Tax=Vannielia litorea TaxID=1217970 RepID=UPI001C963828|nr:allantoinase PuuE [Vannielia litorea]MBY6048609.1 allantoinase PuuE [Vannielia litorea]MBY6076023.1 allantoinase PuuE [Vannielia litorea]